MCTHGSGGRQRCSLVAVGQKESRALPCSVEGDGHGAGLLDANMSSTRQGIRKRHVVELRKTGSSGNVQAIHLCRPEIQTVYIDSASHHKVKSIRPWIGAGDGCSSGSQINDKPTDRANLISGNLHNRCCISAPCKR